MARLFWIVFGLTSLTLTVAFSPWLISEWIWKPWRLILACRKQGIAGFPFIPFVGQIPQISKTLERPESGHDWEELKKAQQCAEKQGKVFYFTTGKTVRICISDPKLLKDILAKNSDSYSKPSFIHVLDILGDGLFRSSGDVWARQRKLLGLAFANKAIKFTKGHTIILGGTPRLVEEAEVGNIVSTARAALKKWLPEINSNYGDLDIYEKLRQLTLNVIKRLAFGEDAAPSSNTEGESSTLLTRAFEQYLHNCRGLVFGPAAAVPGYRFLPTRINRETVKIKKWLLGVVDELIEARSRDYASSPEEPKGHKDFLDVLMDAAQDGSKELTSQQLRDNSMTILLAGHHTTASLLAWTTYMLALQPLWQEKARAEVQELCNGGEVGWDAVSKMKTIAMILHETLRLFPPIPLIGRLCLTENTVGPYKIPQGVEILIPTALIHRDKDLWGEDADQYNPERFANGISKACKHNLGYLPFGSGPRTCIGQTLALAEAKAVLAVILQTFTWKLGPGYRHCPDVSLTLKPKFDIPLVMEKL